MSFEPDARNEYPEAQAATVSLRKGVGYEPEEAIRSTPTLRSRRSPKVSAAEGKDPAKVASALRQAPISTVIGKIGFDAKGDVTGSNYVIYRWHDGKYATVTD